MKILNKFILKYNFSTKFSHSEKLQNLKLENYNTESEYKHMLKKGMALYYKSKLNSNRKKILFNIYFSIFLITIFNLFKYGLVLYYYIMWDIDIRKPRVSDYIINRFR